MQRGSHRLGLNRFADMSPDEFKKSYLHDSQIPSNWDSRKLKDAAADCQNLPVTGAIEGINKIVSGELLTLAPQQLVDCDPASKGCDGGFYFNAFGWVIDNGSVNYPYTPKTGTCKENANKAVTIDNLLVLDGSEEALLLRVSKQPVSVSFDATGLQLYAGGVYSGENCSKDSRNATLIALIVGYGQDYWIVKNSWGKDWGDQGEGVLVMSGLMEYVLSMLWLVFQPNRLLHHIGPLSGLIYGLTKATPFCSVVLGLGPLSPTLHVMHHYCYYALMK